MVADIKIALREQNRPESELIKNKQTESRARVNILIQEKRQLVEENVKLKYYLDYIKTLVPKTETISDDYNEIYNAQKHSEALEREATEIQWKKDREMIETQWQKEREATESNWAKRHEAIKSRLLQELDSNLNDRGKTYKWLIPMVSDIKLILKEWNRRVEELVSTKRLPETKVKINELLREKKRLMEENHELRYQLEYIRTLIPETDNIIDFDEHKTDVENIDKPSDFLSKEEYKSLSDREKNERALKHYKNRNKRNWEIGRDFELFIGYEYECLGYSVEYFGIEKRLEDLGRDLIAKKDNVTLIIQCKYWSKDKVIHEKHIAQLYGTVAMYELGRKGDAFVETIQGNLFKEMIRGVFVTHTGLSVEAKNFARYLRIETIENKVQGEYPLIKCNVNKNSETGEITKIYHLPMDQQYDTTKIDKKNGDFCAFTIEEAEAKGFRRAYRWHGD